MTLPANGVKFVRTTGIGRAAGEFRLEVREDIGAVVANIVCVKYLSLQDLIDLEGQLTMLRMRAELGDKFDEPKKTLQQELADHPNVDDGSKFRAACKILGIDYDEQRDLIAQWEKESVNVGAPTPVASGTDGDALCREVEGLTLPEPKFTGVPTLPTAKTQFAQSTEWVTVDEVGNFVDLVADNKRRHPEIVARRALEEMVELCLAAGASSATILNGVADAIHNQCLKIKERTVFPSQFRTAFNRKDVTEELADIRLVLLDLMHVSSVTEKAVGEQMHVKFWKLKSNPVQNFVTDGHTFYLKKPHVTDAPST